MKKKLICMCLCVLLLGTFLSGCAGSSNSEKQGEGRWQYVESTDEKDNIEYQFDEVTFTLPSSWKDKYDMEFDEDQLIFYHTDSHTMWKENGQEDV